MAAGCVSQLSRWLLPGCWDKRLYPAIKFAEQVVPSIFLTCCQFCTLITQLANQSYHYLSSILCKYLTGPCLERSRKIFLHWRFSGSFRRVTSLLLTNLARDRTERISALDVLCKDLTAFVLCSKDLGPISVFWYSPHIWHSHN